MYVSTKDMEKELIQTNEQTIKQTNRRRKNARRLYKSNERTNECEHVFVENVHNDSNK